MRWQPGAARRLDATPGPVGADLPAEGGFIALADDRDVHQGRLPATKTPTCSGNNLSFSKVRPLRSSTRVG